MTDPLPGILARCEVVRRLVLNAESGPSDVQCRDCGLLAMPHDIRGWTFDVLEPGEPRGRLVTAETFPRRTYTLLGGAEWWVCFLCLRRFEVVWRKPAA